MSDDLLKKSEERAGGQPHIDQFFDSLVETKRVAAQDYSGVPPAVRRRLEARGVVGAPELSTEPKPAVEAVADRTAPTFDYRPEATSGKGDRRGKSVIGDMGGRGDTSGTSEKGAAAEQIGASNPLVSPLESEGKDMEPIPTAQEEKPEVKPETKLDDGGKLVEMETFDPTNKVTAEVDSIKSLVKFETAEDAKDVLDRAQAGENDQSGHFWNKLHEPHLPKEPTPVADKAKELGQAPASNQVPKIEISGVSATDSESSHQAPPTGEETPVDRFMAKTEQPESQTAEQPESLSVGQKTAEQDTAEKPEVIGKIEPDQRITIDDKGAEEPTTSITAERQDSKTAEQATAEEQESKKTGFWAGLFGGGKHGAHDINHMKEPTAADVARVIEPKTTNDERLDRVA